MQASLNITKSTLYLCLSISILQAAYGFGAAQRGGLPTTLDIWQALALYWALAWWFISDSRASTANWHDQYMDMGMFLYIAWIFFLPYYLFKSRGWKALFMIAFFLGLYYGAYFAGALLHLMIGLLV